MIDHPDHFRHLCFGDRSVLFSFRKVSPQKTICMFIGASLPWRMGMCEVEPQPRNFFLGHIPIGEFAPATPSRGFACSRNIAPTHPRKKKQQAVAVFSSLGAVVEGVRGVFERLNDATIYIPDLAFVPDLATSV
jgi:hypothetical protein